MRTIVFIAMSVVVALAGAWVYRGFIRPIDPLPQQVLALAEHFNRRGMEVRPYAVRHNFRHSEVLAVAALKISGFPLPIEVILCPTERSAIERLESVKRSPNLMHPARNGRLVMVLGMWGDDTTDMAKKVTEAFASFDAGSG